jgi:hypothetical protein
MEVKRLEEKDLFEVSSEKTEGKTYVVDVNERNCSCPAYHYYGKCKHLRLVESNLEMMTDRLLAEVY